MRTITLAQAWPYLAGANVFLLGLVIDFLRRYIDRNDREHAAIRSDLQKAIEAERPKNSEQHHEFYSRLREIELSCITIKAQHDQNHGK